MAADEQTDAIATLPEPKEFSLADVFGPSEEQSLGALNGDGDQAGDPSKVQASSEAEPGAETTNAEPSSGADGLVEIEVSGQKVKVPAAVAAEFNKTAKDYRELQVDYTRKAQELAVLKKPAATGEAKPEGEQASGSDVAISDKVHSDVDALLMKSFEENDGKGASKTIMSLAEAVVESRMEEALEKHVAERLAPLEKMVHTLLGEQYFESMVSPFAETICKELGVEAVDIKAVVKSAREIAVKRGATQTDREDVIFAIAKLATKKELPPLPGNKAVQQQRRVPPAASTTSPSSSQLLSNQPAKATQKGPSSEPRMDTLDGL